MNSEITPHFAYWDSFNGLLIEDGDSRFPSAIYGFSGEPSKRHEIPAGGAVYGFVVSGAASINRGDPTYGNGRVVHAGEFFCIPNGGWVWSITEDTKVVAVQRLGWRGIGYIGGPIEEKGRLRYIDTCSDTCLIPPPVRGDPCLNHLHFPPGVDQTEHTHPSTRAGVVARGRGWCITPAGRYALHPGRVFYIPRDGLHRFQTEGESMDVIAYHPDSDFGPTHEEHPMVNRTLVDGQKIDNSTGRHLAADLEKAEV